MMIEETIRRINELYHKSKTAEGLTPEELQEQAKLRGVYMESVRRNLRSQLNHIDMRNEDGSIVNLGEEHGNKKRVTNET